MPTAPTTSSTPTARPDVPGAATAWLAHAMPLLILGLGLAAGRAAEGAASLRASAGWQLVAGVLTLLAVAGCQVGVWRTLARRAGREGATWANRLARGAVLGVGVCLALALAWRHGPGQALEMSRIALGQDPVPAVQAQISPDGRSLSLRGTLGTGSAAVVQQLLRAAPRVTQVRLASAGGRVFEAQAIAGTIHQRGLDTYADGLCASACTVVLLAGRSRGAAPDARIGFHRPQFAGIDDPDRVDAEALIAVYRHAGLGAAFIEQVRRTPAGSMWYPSTAELLRNSVLTMAPPAALVAAR